MEKLLRGKRESEKVKSKVYVIKTTDREGGVKSLLAQFEVGKLSGKVAIKANYNSADEFPATTHIETLRAIVEELGQAEVVLAERSGMGNTEYVLRQMGVESLAEEMGFEIVNLDAHSGWVKFDAEHWKRGFLFADVFYNADFIVQTCCLKTHRFGGHFTMSLKNSVGMVARNYGGYNYMAELHSSQNQRKMIAEINVAYTPFVVIMDAIKGFSKGGPESGELIEPKLMLASQDRVALDAVGVAVLRLYGTTPEVSEGSVFEQEQIARAVELGLGATSANEIELIPLNVDAESVCGEIEKILKG